MIVRNTTNKDRYLKYRLHGGTKTVFFNANETINIPLLTSQSQIIYNSYDLKKKNLSAKFPRRGITPTFTFASGETIIEPSALIEEWWTSLSVKPSNTLMTDLNTLVDGINTDGNWNLLDLFGLIAGMETNEQRLTPLKSTSNEDFEIIGTPTINNNGINPGSGSGYLNLKWNPTDDGVNYTFTSANVNMKNICLSMSANSCPCGFCPATYW